MLANSRQIVKEVNNTTQLDEALLLVVQRAKSSMDANACSVYIVDAQNDQYLLMATDGLIPDAVGLGALVCVNLTSENLEFSSQ